MSFAPAPICNNCGKKVTTRHFTCPYCGASTMHLHSPDIAATKSKGSESPIFQLRKNTVSKKGLSAVFRFALFIIFLGVIQVLNGNIVIDIKNILESLDSGQYEVTDAAVSEVDVLVENVVPTSQGIPANSNDPSAFSTERLGGISFEFPVGSTLRTYASTTKLISGDGGFLVKVRSVKVEDEDFESYLARFEYEYATLKENFGDDAQYVVVDSIVNKLPVVYHQRNFATTLSDEYGMSVWVGQGEVVMFSVAGLEHFEKADEIFDSILRVE